MTSPHNREKSTKSNSGSYDTFANQDQDQDLVEHHKRPNRPSSGKAHSSLGVPSRSSQLYGTHASDTGGGAALSLQRTQSYDTTVSLVSNDFGEIRRVASIPYDGDHEDEDVAGEERDAYGKVATDEEEDEEDDGAKGLEKVKRAVRRSWVRNKGLVWVVLAQIFNVVMNAATRLLESKENGGMHPFQILFARMSITTLLSMLYMWYTQTPHFPFGAKGVRILLVARGFGGFWGVFGIYAALQYLPLADTTVITFLAPMISCYVCSKLLKEEFSRVEQVGAMISLVGVVFIAQPEVLFGAHSPDAENPSDGTSYSDFNSNSSINTITTTVTSASPLMSLLPRALSASETPTSSQRLMGVGMAMVGVVGASIAYVTIRWIGRRAHPLISVNYFAVACTLISTCALLFVPGIPFVLPSTLHQWVLLFYIGVGGFVMQFLLTAGLRYEKGSRATNMVYSQMLFALAADAAIWGDVPGMWSVVGSCLILGSAVAIAVQKGGGTGAEKDDGDGAGKDEERAVAGADQRDGDGLLTGRRSRERRDSGEVEEREARFVVGDEYDEEDEEEGRVKKHQTYHGIGRQSDDEARMSNDRPTLPGHNTTRKTG